MRWIEMIRMRSSSGWPEQDWRSLAAQVREIAAETTGMRDVMVFKHALFDGDLAIVLVWDNDRQPVRTREGLLLADSLQRHGMVDHAVWMAAPGFGEQLDQAEVRPGERYAARDK